MLLNFTNHPSSEWPEKQMDSAKALFVTVEDLPFPRIDPYASSDELEKLAEEYEKIIGELKPAAVHVMGEHTFTYKIVNLLKAKGVPCVASTTQRNAVDDNGVKTSKFIFIRFRTY